MRRKSGMVFETYAPRADKKNNSVAISKNHITLTLKLLEKMKSKDVELAYDSDNKVIRIKPVPDGKGLTISKTNKIGAKGFFSHFNLQVKGKYDGRYDEKDKAIYIQL